MRTRHYHAAAVLAACCASAVGLHSSSAVAQDFCKLEQGKLIESSRKIMVVTREDKELFDEDAFSLQNTLQVILQSAGATNTPADFLKTLIDTFNKGNEKQPGTETVVVSVPERPGELEKLKNVSDLLSADTKNTHKAIWPIGLFNRFDLAPENYAYCGEHRIVYSLDKDADRVKDRFFLIFEAAVVNPNPDKMAEGCRPIAEFWRKIGQGLFSNPKKALRDFYMLGDVDGDGKADMPPVLHATHFGAPFGQIRGNIFMQQSGTDAAADQWELREWRVGLKDGKLAFTRATVKENPVAKLYGNASTGDDLESLRAPFQVELLLQTVFQLTKAEQMAKGPPLSDSEIIKDIGANFSPSFESFFSIPRKENPTTIDVDDSLQNKIDAILKIIKPGIPHLKDITGKHILNRAGAVSCGGCHDFSGKEDIAPGVKWPSSRNFVHIDERGALSKALTDFFLPARCNNLQDFLLKRSGKVATKGAPNSFKNFSLNLKTAKSPKEAADLIEQERLIDRNTPGAFVHFRRTH